MAQHLIFYDGTCGLCDLAVQFVLKRDKQEIFAFAPLQGTTAQALLQKLTPEMKTADSLILVENYQTTCPIYTTFGKGALRICWLLGGSWKIAGALSFLPSILYDWAYRLVAQNRHRFFPNSSCVVPTKETKHRFLD